MYLIVCVFNRIVKVGQLVVVACDLVCDYVGINEFIDMIQNADLDSIYGCQLVGLCPVNDCKVSFSHCHC